MFSNLIYNDYNCASVTRTTENIRKLWQSNIEGYVLDDEYTSMMGEMNLK